MPSTAFAQTAEDLYLNALGFDGGAMVSTVCDMIATDPCSAPLQVLTTPELIQQGPSSLTARTTSSSPWRTNSRRIPALSARHDPLTIFGYSQSATAESIADELCISELTVKSHIGRIFVKLQPRDRSAAIVYAYDHGLVTPRYSTES